MRHDVQLESGDMGRRPSETPKAIHLGIRVDSEMIHAIDLEIAEIQHERPGLNINRSDVVRMWITEAIQRRAKRR